MDSNTNSSIEQHFLHSSLIQYKNECSNTSDEIFCKNCSLITTTIDSGYNSVCNCGTSYTTLNTVSSQFTSNIVNITEPYAAINVSVNQESLTKSDSNENKLTPVTQSIQKICDFHITTPKTDDLLINENTPIGCNKRLSSVLELSYEDYQNTPKKAKLTKRNNLNRHLSEIETKATISSIRNRKHKRSLFKEKLQSAPDLGINFFHDDTENINNSLQLTPIQSLFNASDHKRTPLSSNNTNQIKASTPKLINKLKDDPSTFSGKNSASVQKLLSFSDKEFEALLNSSPKEENTQQQNQPVTILSNTQSNLPSIVTKRQSRKFLESKSDQCSLNIIYEEKNLNDYKELYPVIENEVRDSRIFKRSLSTNKINEIKNEIFLENHSPSNTSKINSVRKKKQNNKNSIGFQCILGYKPSSLDLKISNLDSNHIENQHEIETLRDSITNNNELQKKNLQELLAKDQYEQILKNRSSTPPPSLHYSVPFNHENVLTTNFSDTEQSYSITPPKKTKYKSYSVDYELNEILHPFIPKTPTKKSSIISTKQKDYITVTGSALKRRLSEDNHDKRKRSKVFYDGFTHLNIIAKLESYALVLNRIFDMLSSQDLYNLSLTSKSLRNIVLNNRKANEKLNKFLCNRQIHKENIFSKSNTSQLSLSPSANRNSATTTIKSKGLPFRNINKQKSIMKIELSPPVSPSKRKFHENQKIVKTLKAGEKLVKCPRCSKSSRIINVATDPKLNSKAFHLPSTSNSYFNDFKNNNNNNNFESTTLSQPSSSQLLPVNSSSSSSTSSSFVPIIKPRFVKCMSADSMFLVSRHHKLNATSNIDGEKYGECSGIICKFRFCLKCLCEYHPGTKCIVGSNLNDSPTKDDIFDSNSPYKKNTTGTLSTNSRSLKNKRRSLKRLCF